MKIHEYQAKEIFKRFSIPVPIGYVVDDLEKVKEVVVTLGVPVVVKAQIHAGGRGKGGGIKLAKIAAEAITAAKSLLGKKLVTPQTGPDGQPVNKLLIEKAVDIEKEYYLGILLDRSKSLPLVMASAAGGMDIEEVAAKDPSLIKHTHFDPFLGLWSYQSREIAKFLGIESKLLRKFEQLLRSLAKLYLELDASLVEINPLVLTKEGDFIALDAKINFDDNALFRHPEIIELRDYSQEDPLETEASRYNLNYIKLDGNIGCMVNGAGLAMATMDIIKLYGGEPANFLDVGGGATQDAVKNAFRILISDPSVKAVLINIFGGIARTDRIARGVVAAIEELGEVKIPVVVRLEGTNVEEGRRILREANFDFIVAENMSDAAEKVVKAVL